MKASAALRKRAVGGFTLLEVTFAVAIIAVGFLGSFAMVLQSGKQAAAAEESSLVSTALEQEIDLLRASTWSNLTTTAGVASTLSNSISIPQSISGLNSPVMTLTIGDYGPSSATYQKLGTASPWNFTGSPNLSLSSLGGAVTQTLSSAQVVQVSVTITWTGRRSGHSMAQTLTTVISEGGISNSVLP